MKLASIASIPAGCRVLVLGLGQTGVAAARWCVRHGAVVRVVDTRAVPPGLEALQSLPEGSIELFVDQSTLDESLLEDVQLLVLSPGLSPLQEPVKGFLGAAGAQGIEVVGEIELFARALADYAASGYKPRVLAVTGTNGKTTVTTMAVHLLQTAGVQARAAGNISPSALDALAQASEADTLPEVWVLELSSFQLHTTRSLKADAAVVLNLSQDHLDWHGSMAAYAEAKAALLRQARVAVVNRDDELVLGMIDELQAASVRSFGSDEPFYEGDLGLQEQQGLQWLCASQAVADDEPRSGTRASRKAGPVLRRAGALQQLMPVDALPVRGRHNALNALAALALVRSLEVAWAPLLHALRDYQGEPDRTEFVRSVGGVDFINDSKGTNVGATVAALEGLGQRAVLIAGGLGKGQDFSPLAAAVGRFARAVVLIGQDAPILEAAMQAGRTSAAADFVVTHATTLPEAVAEAWQLAKPGDAVLLSPACASMDMFANYRERGRVFVDAVHELALENGEVA